MTLYDINSLVFQTIMGFLATILFLTFIPCFLAEEKSLGQMLTEKSLTKLKEKLASLVDDIEKEGEI